MPQCSVCQKDCKSEHGLIQHMEMKHGAHGVHQGVSAWEAQRRQVGELTTGSQSCQVAYEIDRSDFNAHTCRWECSMPGCRKTFSDQQGYQNHLSSGAHESKLYRCSECDRTFRRLADLKAHTSKGSCASARASRSLRTFMHDAQQSQLMLADRLYDQAAYYEATLSFDGAARPNPGTGGWGFMLRDDNGSQIDSGCGGAGTHATSNQAEYHGLIQGLQSAVQNGIRRLQVKGDSELVINQMNGVYQARSHKLSPLYETAKKLARSQFLNIDFQHVYREHNTEADELAGRGVEIQQRQHYAPY